MAVELLKNLYMIDGFVREFFIIGDEYVLLIDTGIGQINMEETIREYSNLPIKVVLTHGHGDHTNGARGFDDVYLHQKDWFMYDGNKKEMMDHIECGGYSFDIIEMPGHTPGSIGLYDKDKGLLIAGDSVQQGPIFMFGQYVSLEDYEKTLEKLLTLNIQTILASHHECVLSSDYIQYCLDDLHAYQRGELEGVEHHQPDCTLYTGKKVSFFL